MFLSSYSNVSDRNAEQTVLCRHGSILSLHDQTPGKIQDGDLSSSPTRLDPTRMNVSNTETNCFLFQLV